MGNRVVSQAIPKVDYKALVTGKAVYTDDLAAKDSLVVKVLRSPYAHADADRNHLHPAVVSA